MSKGMFALYREKNHTPVKTALAIISENHFKGKEIQWVPNVIEGEDIRYSLIADDTINSPLSLSAEEYLSIASFDPSRDNPDTFVTNGGSRRRRSSHGKRKSYRKSKRVRHTRRKQTRRHRR